METLFGRNPVYEVLRAGRRQPHALYIAEGVKTTGVLDNLLQLAAQAGLQPQSINRAELDQKSQHHQGVALEVDPYPYSTLDQILEKASQASEPALILLLDVIQDPQNLGTLMRTAEAVGVHGLIIPPRRAAGITEAVVRASSGASEHLLVTQENLDQSIRRLQEADIWVAGLEVDPDAQMLGQANLSGALGLVVGSEGSGLRRLVKERCDFLLQLPMRGQVSSLNAAVAGSIALYAIWEARNYRGGGRR
ncbi:MAG: 23S rRNA (guanosine(2251)-2'-O)-methyltransferase RlmB [Anaerolineales bacterium]|jgi:23S rRNA (guanosine2251-2'-O)-methyltransferase